MAVSDSGILDFSESLSPPGAGPTRGQRWGSRVLVLVFIVGVAGVALFGTWLHFQQAHDADLAAYQQLRDRLVRLDRTIVPLRHGETPPCSGPQDDGVIVRTYSPQTGPSPRRIGRALQLLGFSVGERSSGALLTLVDEVDGRRLIVDVSGPALDARGVSLRATSATTALACSYG